MPVVVNELEVVPAQPAQTPTAEAPAAPVPAPEPDVERALRRAAARARRLHAD